MKRNTAAAPTIIRERRQRIELLSVSKSRLKQPPTRCTAVRPRNAAKLMQWLWTVLTLSLFQRSKNAAFAWRNINNDRIPQAISEPETPPKRQLQISQQFASYRVRGSDAAFDTTTPRPTASGRQLRPTRIAHNISITSRPTHKPTLAPRKKVVSERPVRPTLQPFELPTFHPFRLPPHKPLNTTQSTSPKSLATATTRRPTTKPSVKPSARTPIATKPVSTVRPTQRPTMLFFPSDVPSESPTLVPSDTPSRGPSLSPSDTPSSTPSLSPSRFPSKTPSTVPSSSPSVTMMTIPQDELVIDFDGLPMLSSINDHNQSILVWENITSQHVLDYWRSIPFPRVVVTNVTTEFQSQVTISASSSTHDQLFFESSATTTTRVTYGQTITYGILPPQISDVKTEALFTRPFTSNAQDYVNRLIQALNTTGDIVLDNFYFGLPSLSPSPAPAPPHERKLNNGWIAIIVVGSVVMLVIAIVGIWLGWQKGHRHISPPPPPPPTPDMSRTFQLHPAAAAAAAMYHEDIPSRRYSNVESTDYAYSLSGSVKDMYLERSSSDLLGEEQPPGSQSNIGITASVSTTSSSVFREPSVVGGGGGIGSISFGTDGGIVARPSSDNLQGLSENDSAALASVETPENGEEEGRHHRPRLASADFLDSNYHRHVEVSDYRRVHSSGDLGEESDYIRPSDFGGGDNITDQTGSGGIMTGFSPLPTAFPLLANIEEVDYDVTSPSATDMTLELPGDNGIHVESNIVPQGGGVLSDDEDRDSQENHIFSMTGFNLQIMDLDDM